MLCETDADRVEQAWTRVNAGDGRAFDDLIEFAYDWLGGRVVEVLRRYRSVRLPPDEVLHDRVLGRLRNALARVPPRSCAEFTRLAGRHIRLALHDVIREERARRDGTSLDAVAGGEAEVARRARHRDEGDVLDDLVDYRERAKFHEAAAALPVALRRVFCLRYYAGLSEAEAAAKLRVTERTVRNRWRQAVDGLSVALTGAPFQGQPPRLRREGDAPEEESPCA
jgi:RNA polymerase sigma factor (sigma-70 family)